MPTVKIKLSEIVKLKQRGYSNRQIAKRFRVSSSAIDKALLKAEEKGLWDGKSGTDEYEDGTAEHPFTIENIIREEKKERREVLPNGSLKPKPFPKYRCLKKKCRKSLTPLEEVYFVKGKDHIRKDLIAKGYSHICLKCLTVYERSRELQKGEFGNCPDCGTELVMTSYKNELTNLLWCYRCKEGFYAGDEELKSIEGFAEKSNL